MGIEPIGVLQITSSTTLCAETGRSGVDFGAIDLPQRCLILTWGTPGQGLAGQDGGLNVIPLLAGLLFGEADGGDDVARFTPS